MVNIKFMELNDAKFEDFTKELFQASEVKVSSRDYSRETVTVRYTTEGWIDSDTGKEFSIEDTVVYSAPSNENFISSIDTEYPVCASDVKSYISFLIKNNVNPLLDLVL